MLDSEIVALFLERSEQAVTALKTKYGSAVRGVVSGILKDSRDVEECVNDTYFQIWEAIPPQKPEKLGVFSCRVARNVSLTRHDFNSAHRRNNYYDSPLDELSNLLPAVTAVEEQCDANRLAELINEFLDHLSQNERYLFVQRYWCGAAVKQLAVSAGTTAHAVSVRLFRIRERLKKFLKKEGYIV